MNTYTAFKNGLCNQTAWFLIPTQSLSSYTTWASHYLISLCFNFLIYQMRIINISLMWQMRLEKDNVKYSVHCLAHGRHSATVSNDDDDSEDRWPTFNCTSSVRSYFPPFPGILISSFHYIDFCAIIKTNFSFSFFLSFFFLGLHLWHIDVLRLGVQLEL